MKEALRSRHGRFSTVMEKNQEGDGNYQIKESKNPLWGREQAVRQGLVLNQDLVDQTEDMQVSQPAPPSRMQGRQLHSNKNDNRGLSRNGWLTGKGFPSASSNFRHHPEKNSVPTNGSTNTAGSKRWGGCAIHTIELPTGINA